MMHVFLANNRRELIDRCRAKVAQRPAREATAQQLQNGVPLFLDQFSSRLRLTVDDDASNEIGATATIHGARRARSTSARRWRPRTRPRISRKTCAASSPAARRPSP